MNCRRQEKFGAAAPGTKLSCILLIVRLLIMALLNAEETVFSYYGFVATKR
jgi:hypothetical protein